MNYVVIFFESGLKCMQFHTVNILAMPWKKMVLLFSFTFSNLYHYFEGILNVKVGY